jgi:hypothetical protein
MRGGFGSAPAICTMSGITQQYDTRSYAISAHSAIQRIPQRLNVVYWLYVVYWYTVYWLFGIFGIGLLVFGGIFF